MALKEQDLAQFLAINAREAVAITQTPSAESDTSFCGGYPTLPVSLDWPIDPNGHECIFLAQINLAELEVLPDGWPASGQLFVFLNAALESMDETATDAPFLFYATADQVLEKRVPTTPIHGESYFWYEGDGPAGMGRKGSISLGLDALPRTGCRFARFTDYNHPFGFAAGDKELLSREELDAVKNIDAEPDQIANMVGDTADRNRAGVSVQPQEPHRDGGFELIDPGFRLRATWWGRPERYANTKGPAHPYFADWPHTALVVFHHAKGISFAEQYGAERDNACDALSGQIASEAESWMRWAKEQGDAPLSEHTRQEYRRWCQQTLAKCFDVARPTVYDPPRVWRKFYSLRKRLYELVPKARRKAREERRSVYAHRIREIENLYDPIFKVRGPTEEGSGMVGQLFGYGENVQIEADVHRGKTLVFQCSALRGISFGGGDFKLWLATTDLKPNAWQKVVAINATT
jgi:hypothetical protein